METLSLCLSLASSLSHHSIIAIFPVSIFPSFHSRSTPAFHTALISSTFLPSSALSLLSLSPLSLSLFILLVCVFFRRNGQVCVFVCVCVCVCVKEHVLLSQSQALNYIYI